MGMFDDVILDQKSLQCLTKEEIKILEKQGDGFHFQTKSFDNCLFLFEVLNGKIYQNDMEMKKFRDDISIYDAEIYTYFQYEDKFVDCELNLHIKEGVIQEIKKKIFEIKDPPDFQYPVIVKKFGYTPLMFFSNIFSKISFLFRKAAWKRRILKN
jgi:hypothetical protein